MKDWAIGIGVGLLLLGAGALGYWATSGAPRPLEVYVHFDQPLVVKVQ